MEDNKKPTISDRIKRTSIWLSQYSTSKWMCLVCNTHHPSNRIVCLKCNKGFSPDFDSSSPWVCHNVFCAQINVSYALTCCNCRFKKKDDTTAYTIVPS